MFFALSKQLAKKGHRVFVVTSRLKGTRSPQTIEGVEVHRVGIPIDYQGRLPVGLLQNVIYVVFATLQGIRLIVLRQIDVIHSNTYAPVFPGLICASLFRRPHIITVHDVYFLGRKSFWRSWSRQENVPAITLAMGPIVERIVLMLRPYAFHTVSRASASDLRACSVRSHVFVIPNAVDVASYESREPMRFQFLFLGRLVFYKNLEVVIKAVKVVRKQEPQVCLVVAGDGPMREDWKALSKSLGLESSIFFLGRVSDHEKIQLLSKSTAIVFPSIIEGFGIAVLEAFASSRPVLAASVPPLTEIVHDGVDGFLIPPFDDKAWADRMLELARHPGIAARLGLSGRALVEKRYALNEVTQTLERAYRASLDRT